MMPHADVVELAELYVLGALPEDVAEALEEHLTDCAVCRSEVRRSWAVAQLLRAAVPPHDPSPDLRSRLMEIVAAEASGVPAPGLRVLPRSDTPAQPRLRLTWTLGGALGLAGAAAILPLLLAGWLALQLVSLQGELRSTEAALQASSQIAQEATAIMAKAMERDSGGMVRVNGAEMAPAASGMLFFVRNENNGVLVVGGLPPLPQGEVYQCWLTSGGKRMSGGTFYREADGRGILVIRAPMPFEAVEAVGVTSEPHGGSSEPRGSRYMWGQLKGT